MLIVGLTGGIACGKSKVSAYIRAAHSIPVIDLDELSRRVVRPGRRAHDRIVRHFGEGILCEDGEIDREKLGALIFNDRAARRALNGATHFSILLELLLDLANCYVSGHHAVVLDAPLLFESGLHHLCATCVVVHCSEDVQMARMQTYRGHSRDEAASRIASQLPVARKMAMGDHLLENNGSVSDLEQRTTRLLDAMPVGRLPLPHTRHVFGTLVLCPLLFLFAVWRLVWFTR